MQIIRELSELEPAVAALRGAGDTLALVPTMGALHAGHLALIAEGRRRAAHVAATVFVNPLQFNDPGDLARYPRTEEADLARLKKAGCDLVWLPTPDQLYPQGFATNVSVRGVSDRWEGEHRPGHFDGVATVVAKLLLAVRPTHAIFGEKDWQQLAVIRRVEEDLGIGVAILGYPTVREANGLAMSSRNALLSPEQRAKAAALPTALRAVGKEIAAGGAVTPALQRARAALLSGEFSKVDYLALVDSRSLEPLEKAGEPMRLIAAATIGGVRLIDNMAVTLEQQVGR
ncbi:pantoate--beta-alanine ligase [Sphingomonas sp. LHG3443-2]|uniref:pantoate--beta-alanine ligase n=1 Tax=Sphingomonas sp. LHG3443-2 TaxID=2804639 RepID=UPI003CF42605